MLTTPSTIRSNRQKVLGMILFGTGLLGIVLSVAGLLLVAYAGAAAEVALKRQLDTFERALIATGDGLDVADSALADTRVTLTQLSTTINSATRAITETKPTLDILQDLTSNSLPQTINSTRQALGSAQETARIIDGVLSTIAVFGVRYDPEVPLNEAIRRVSDSLAPIPESLNEVSQGLEDAGVHLADVSGDLSQVAFGLDTIAESVGESAAVIEQYQLVVGDLRSEIGVMRETAPGWITAGRVTLMLLMIWLGLAQLSLLTQGWERIRGGAQAS